MWWVLINVGLMQVRPLVEQVLPGQRLVRYNGGMTDPIDESIASIMASVYRKGRKLTVPEVARMVGIKPSTWRQYVYSGAAPKSDGKFGPARGPWWYEGTIERYLDDKKVGRVADLRDEHGLKMRVNRRAYDAAARCVERGEWAVYPEIGIVDAPAVTMTNQYKVTVFHAEDGSKFSVLHHRVVYEWRNGEYEPTHNTNVIDHINRIKHDNRIINLRELTQQQNLLNRLWSDGNESHLLDPVTLARRDDVDVEA